MAKLGKQKQSQESKRSEESCSLLKILCVSTHSSDCRDTMMINPEMQKKITNLQKQLQEAKFFYKRIVKNRDNVQETLQNTQLALQNQGKRLRKDLISHKKQITTLRAEVFDLKLKNVELTKCNKKLSRQLQHEKKTHDTLVTAIFDVPKHLELSSDDASSTSEEMGSNSGSEVTETSAPETLPKSRGKNTQTTPTKPRRNDRKRRSKRHSASVSENMGSGSDSEVTEASAPETPQKRRSQNADMTPTKRIRRQRRSIRQLPLRSKRSKVSKN